MVYFLYVYFTPVWIVGFYSGSMLPSEPTPLSPQQRCSIRVQTDIVYNVHISGDQSPRKYPRAGMTMVQKQQLTCEASTTPRTCDLSDGV